MVDTTSVLTFKIKTMKTKYLFFLLPLIVLAELYCFSWIVELLRQRSDTAVLIGIALTCGFITGNYFLVKFITKTK